MLQHLNHPEGREMTTNQERLFAHLAGVSDAIAKGHYTKAKQLFELTKKGKYPPMVAKLAEAFGMMMVKVEAREFHLEELVDSLKKAQKELSEAKERLAKQNVNLRQNLRDKFSPSDILGRSSAIRDILAKIEKMAHTSAGVLITGETGTGKELVAKALHYNSSRADKPFVAINCSAVPEQIFESEIFGIEKGVATGVDKRIGKIEQAHEGTLFLDEIGDMPIACQAKMLRAIEEQQVERVGGRKAIPVDVRIIAATNKELKQEAQEGRFRADLFYRLNILSLHVPPLRDRKNDVQLLATHFLDISAKKLGKQPMTFTPEAMHALTAHSWPGNVRELENEVERAVILAMGLTIGTEDLSEYLRAKGDTRDDQGGLSVKGNEKALIRKALADADGNKSKAARLLDISREGLRKKMKRLGLA